MDTDATNIKALFFDVDGTLVSFRTHRIPTSAVEAIHRAKERGAKVFIATGRPMSIINNIDEIQPLVDGYITTNGARCIMDGKTIGSARLPQADVDNYLHQAAIHGYAAMMESEGGICVHQDNEEAWHIFHDMLDIDYRSIQQPEPQVLAYPILQITPIINQAQQDKLMPLMPGCKATRWYPAFCDVTAVNSDKGYGLEAFARYTGIPLSQMMAFGDGGNDTPMIRKAGIGVAMGNAGDDVKAAANYVTTSVDDDGIARALAHFGF